MLSFTRFHTAPGAPKKVSGTGNYQPPDKHTNDFRAAAVPQVLFNPRVHSETKRKRRVLYLELLLLSLLWWYLFLLFWLRLEGREM